MKTKKTATRKLKGDKVQSGLAAVCGSQGAAPFEKFLLNTAPETTLKLLKQLNVL
jgi:hypothetical protein